MRLTTERPNYYPQGPGWDAIIWIWALDQFLTPQSWQPLISGRALGPATIPCQGPNALAPGNSPLGLLFSGLSRVEGNPWISRQYNVVLLVPPRRLAFSIHAPCTGSPLLTRPEYGFLCGGWVLSGDALSGIIRSCEADEAGGRATHPSHPHRQVQLWPRNVVS